MAEAPKMRAPIETGCPDGFQYMHPLMIKNYGNWAYHDRPRPGVLHHVSKSGDEIWTVRVGTQRQLGSYEINLLCDIVDKYGEGHVRFTIRSNLEVMVSSWDKVGPLIQAFEDAGYPVGGTGNSVTMISHTQGWLHCDIPGTDAAGVVKALMDDLHEEFVKEDMPNRVHITTSCCQINCGGQGDIAINIQHTKPPKINHDLVANVCERPSVVARCPVAAIRPAMQINDPEHSKLAVWVGGKNSNARSKPMFHKLVAAGIPNNPPRWPEAGAIVKKILRVYKEDAKDWERVGDWVERIGWPRFFELTELPFTKFHIDNWRGSRSSLNASAHIRF
jgi:sulfite reductase beta subunit